MDNGRSVALAEREPVKQEQCLSLADLASLLPSCALSLFFSGLIVSDCCFVQATGREKVQRPCESCERLCADSASNVVHLTVFLALVDSLTAPGGRYPLRLAWSRDA